MIFKNFCLLLCTLSIVYAAKLPNEWKVCKKSDPKYSSCLKNGITSALRSLKNGNKELQIASIDPIRLDQITLKQGAGRAIGLTMNFTNLIIRGLSDANVDKANIDLKKNVVSFELIPEGPLVMESDYTSNGRILLIPIKGAGKSTLTFDGFKAKFTLHCKIVNKKGNDHFDCQKADINIDTKKLHLFFKRTVNANEGFAQHLNTFLNENWKDILEDLKPSISQEFGKVVIKFANQVFSQVPLKDISPQ